MENNNAKEELKKKISRLIDKKGENIDMYKDIVKIIWDYLRYVLGYMSATLIMERAFYITEEKFPDFKINLTNELELDNIKDPEVLKFCIDCLIEYMEKLAGDVLLKKLTERLSADKKARNEL